MVDEDRSMVVSLLLLALFSLLVASALLGNLLVVVAIFYDRPLRRQPENLFLVSLAVSDLLVSILVMICAAVNDLLGHWLFGQVYCQFWISFDITCCTASILNLCAISLDRYWHISRPMVYVRYCSRRRIYYCIVLVWLVSALLGAVPLILSSGSPPKPDTCQMNLTLPYAIGSSMLSFFVPAAVMVLLYTKLYLYARRHVRSIKTQLHQATSFLIMQLASEKIREVTAASLGVSEGGAHRVSLAVSTVPIDSSNHLRPPVHSSITSLRMSRWDKVSRHLPGGRSASTQLSTENTPANGNRNTVNDQKARLTLGVIMGTFLLCWLPFFLVNIWRSATNSGVNHDLIVAVTWLGYANSAANPIIYSIFNRDFRRAFKKIIVDIFACCQSTDPTLCKSSNRLAMDCTGERRRSTRSSEGAENNNLGAASTRLVLMNNNENSVGRLNGTPEISIEHCSSPQL